MNNAQVQQRILMAGKNVSIHKWTGNANFNMDAL